MTPPVMVRYSYSPDKKNNRQTTNKHSSKNENLYSYFVGCCWNRRNKKKSCIRILVPTPWKGNKVLVWIYFYIVLVWHRTKSSLFCHSAGFFDIYLHIKCVDSHSHHAERSWVKWSTGDIWTYLSHPQILPAPTDLKRLNSEENVLLLYLLSVSRSSIALLRLFIALTLVFSCFILP